MNRKIVRVSDSGDRDRIESYLSKTEGSSLYHHPLWREVIRDSFRHESHYLFCENDVGDLCGVLPIVHMKSLLFGNFMVSMPYFNYGGVCAEDETSRDFLIRDAVRIATEEKVTHIEFRQENPLNNGFPVKTAKVSMRLILPETSEELWDSFPSKLRSQIRVPEKAGMKVRIGRLDELESFYHVFSINMRYLGTPVYPKKFFGNILRYFPERTWICTVYSGEIAVASGFLAGWKNRLEIPWASSIRNYNRQSPNMLLYWSCLSFACKKGFEVFDFGRSTFGEKTYKFKEQWGAKPTLMNWHYWLRHGERIPDISPRNPKYELAIGLWRKLPLSFTRRLGPLLIKNIP